MCKGAINHNYTSITVEHRCHWIVLKIYTKEQVVNTAHFVKLLVMMYKNDDTCV